nr:hypothetical protein [Prochlorococcus marinus]
MSKQADHLVGYFLMPYEMNKTAYKVDNNFEREKEGNPISLGVEAPSL